MHIDLAICAASNRLIAAPIPPTAEVRGFLGEDV
jgi:hypothetical protein